MGLLRRFNLLAERVEEPILLISFWALGIVVFCQFFFRYFIGMPLGWTEELARYLLIAVCFLGLPVATRRGEHISIELTHSLLRGRSRLIAELVVETLQLVLVVILMVQAFQLTNLSSQMMSSLPLPKSLIYQAVLLGLGLHAVASINHLSVMVGKLRAGSSDR